MTRLSDQAIDGGWILERVRAHVDGAQFAALLVVSPANVNYVSGIHDSQLHSLPYQSRAVVWPRAGKPVMLVPSASGLGRASDLELTWDGLQDAGPLIDDVRAYEGGRRELVRAIAGVLTDLGITDANLGIELDRISLGMSQELGRVLPRAQQVDGGPILDALRAIKSPAEVARLTAVNRAVAESLDQVLCEVKPGDTERMIVARVTSELCGRGAQSFEHVSIAAGPRPMFREPTDEPIEAGMLLGTEWSVRIDGYCSAIARSAVVGRASKRQRDAFARVSEAHDAIVDALRPGLLASDVLTMATSEYKRRGLEFEWGSAGHGVGILGCEPPYLRHDAHDPLLAGMTFALGFGVIAEREVYQLKDLVHLTQDGAVNMTQRLPGRSLIESQY